MRRQHDPLRRELRRTHSPTHGAFDLRDRRLRETVRVDIQRPRAQTFRGCGQRGDATHRVALRLTLADAPSDRWVGWRCARLGTRQLGGWERHSWARREIGISLMPNNAKRRWR
jgi:hypothetical protein